MIILRLTSMLLILSLYGCASLIRVYEDDPNHEGKQRQISGIPFYAKTIAYKQDTVYERYYYEVSLVRKEVQNNAGSPNKGENEITYGTKWIGKEGRAKLAKIQEMIIRANASQDEEDRVDAIYSFLKLPAFKADDSGYFEEMTTNNVQSISVVDYDHKLYLNAPLPWFGSGQASWDFNADGTLTKASSEVTTGVAEGVSKLLSIAEPLVKAAPPSPPAPVETVKLVLTLVIEKKGNVYDFTLIHKGDPRTNDNSCPSPQAQQTACILKPIPFNTKNGNFTMKPIGSAKTEEPDDKTSNKIKFSGDKITPKQLLPNSK